MAPATALLDELAEEILLRFPADDPAGLVRAALACKRSRRLVADPGFRRRFREFHGAPPVLGVFRNTISVCSIGGRRNIGGGGLVTYGFGGRARAQPSAVARFVPTSSCLAGASWRDWRVVDARHGRALLYKRRQSWDSDDRLVVWDPVTGEKRELPAIPGSPFEIKDPFSWNAAVLCAAAGCNHLDCHRKPFAVVFVAIVRTVMFDCFYSSEAGRWSQPAAHCAQQTDDRLKLEPSVLVGNVLYFMLQSRAKILNYSISTREMGVIDLPTVCFSERRIVFMAIEDGGGLGFATVRDSKLCLWSMEVGSDGDAGWAQRGTNDGVVTIDLKSSRVTRVPKISGGSSIFPYMSFYYPALGAPAASSGGDGPGTGASSVSKA
ncbi:unnamed protein product [Urochloa decumbens]|uniref:F-box protein AT5G49610-like beta-propeller domain-containing protein n=1 Tax=Urochloa decumbens TaxID=240449 RepID=A0ABC9GEI1_9POAL